MFFAAPIFYILLSLLSLRYCRKVVFRMGCCFILEGTNHHKSGSVILDIYAGGPRASSKLLYLYHSVEIFVLGSRLPLRVLIGLPIFSLAGGFLRCKSITLLLFARVTSCLFIFLSLLLSDSKR